MNDGTCVLITKAWNCLWTSPLLSHNFSEQQKLRIYNGFSQFRDKIVVKNFGSKQVNAYPIEDFSYRM